jgi:hypothetical protein
MGEKEDVFSCPDGYISKPGPGISFGIFGIHRNSIRLGSQPSMDGQTNTLFSYIYNKGLRTVIRNGNMYSSLNDFEPFELTNFFLEIIIEPTYVIYRHYTVGPEPKSHGFGGLGF